MEKTKMVKSAKKNVKKSRKKDLSKNTIRNRLSVTQLTMFMQCPMLYRWQYIAKIQVKSTPTYFLFGRAVAEWIEVFHKGQKLDPRIVASKHFDLAIAAAPNPTYEAKLRTDKARVIGSLAGYSKAYASEFGKLVDATPEMEFEFPIGDESVLFGKIDLMYKSDNEWRIRETKTATNPSGAYFTRLPIDWQLNAYVWGALHALKRKVFVVEYDVISKPSHRIKVKETWDEYADRIAKEYSNPNDFAWRFFRHQIVIDNTQLNIWHRHATLVAKEIEKAKRSNGKSCYQNSSQCNSPYGACSMLDACLNRKPSKLLYEPKRYN